MAAQVIADHPRSYDTGDMMFDPVHDLPLIARKIMSFDQAAPLQGWDLPDAFKHLLLCRVERRPPRLDLDIYPFLPRTNIATTSASSYMSLLAGDGA